MNVKFLCRVPQRKAIKGKGDHSEVPRVLSLMPSIYTYRSSGNTTRNEDEEKEPC